MRRKMLSPDQSDSEAQRMIYSKFSGRTFRHPHCCVSLNHYTNWDVGWKICNTCLSSEQCELDSRRHFSGTLRPSDKRVDNWITWIAEELSKTVGTHCIYVRTLCQWRAEESSGKAKAFENRLGGRGIGQRRDPCINKKRSIAIEVQCSALIAHRQLVLKKLKWGLCLPLR